ncbi:uncharacterized protein F5147DRAFT_779530 [Suillus discolor]|uniref:Uncharacterized protein n=1 Tax=Suillus discolor TaxID=1912936 RepID=A0A9P7JNK3_9AGAM|nr:uncharacterized protein F5147DRAFT_779530 [Suillus discolor]KAG2092786.1 hypothetical protein F5147DRAFT_779530 [Suillus discolor]
MDPQNPDDQYRLTLLAIIEAILRLEKLDHRLDKLERRLDASDHSVRDAMQEIRSIKNLAGYHRLGLIMEHSGGRDGTVDSKAGVNDLNATSLGSWHDSQIAASHGTSSGVIESLSGGTTGLLSYGARSSPITFKHVGGRDGIVGSQAQLNSLNAIPLFIPSHGPYLVPQPAPHEVSYGVTGSVSEDTEGLLLNGTLGFANNVTHLGLPVSYDMDGIVDSQAGINSLDAVLPSISSHDPYFVPQPAPHEVGSVVQISQTKVKVNRPKVKCPRDKCPKFISEDGLTRHINEVHEKKVVTVCPGCKKAFTRMNVMTHHVCPFGGS